MKRSVPFEFFGEGQYLEFTIGSLREFEKAMGNMQIGEILERVASLSVLTTGLMIGLKHHYRHKPITFFDRKLEEYLENGGDLKDIIFLLSKAIMVSGIFGKTIGDAAEKAGTDEEFADNMENTDGDEKNV